jgi:hypothetical protein
LSKDLNIITLNVPYPPDYGGMIDTYYRIKSLYDLGIRVHLHCFEYGRPHSEELESLCKTINYYPRKSGLSSHLSLLPYIVSSRKSKALLDNLLRNEYPILFDGLHSTYYIDHQRLSNRRKFVRVHNIEHRYYQTLATHESNLKKKLFFGYESFKLKRYEKVLEKADFVLPISINEQEYFNSEYHNSAYLAPFHPYNESESLTGNGAYILYHSDLSVNGNAAIAESLIANVFSKISYTCIIAGKNPPPHILSVASGYSNIQIVSNPDKNEMTGLIRNAHIHLLPAIESNGFKIKLLLALFAGRHCLVNSKMTEGTNTGKLCHIADSDKDILDMIHFLMQKDFTGEMINERRAILSEYYNNSNNAKKLAAIIFNA